MNYSQSNVTIVASWKVIFFIEFQMGLFFDILLIISVTLSFVYIGLGWRAVSARRYLIRGAEFARQGNFETARESGLIAVRQNPEFRKNSEVQLLYEIISVKSNGASLYEINRILSVIPMWRKTTPETLVENDLFKAGMIIFWIIVFFLRIYLN